METVKEEHKQLCLSLQFSGINTMNILKMLSATKMKKHIKYIGILVLIMHFFSIEGCRNPSIGFIEEEVVFNNKLDGAILSGTLTKPIGKDTFPVAILISGAGQQDRDETVYGHKPFKVLAEFLSNNGIGVLRYDDRGVGGSKGNVWNATLEVQASDAYAGIQYLKTRKDVDIKNIGIIGHSFGAMQGTILASKYPDISFLVLLGGIGIPWSENHIKADRLSNKLKGEHDEIIEAGSQLLNHLLKAMKSMPTNQEYQISKNILVQIIERWQSSLTGKAKTEIEEFTKSHPDFWIKNFAEEYATPIYISCAQFEPYNYLIKIHCPVLSIIGEKDVQVVPENNGAIEMALKRVGNNNYKVIAPKDINHLFQKCETGLISEYEKIDEDFNLNVMMDISDWINENKSR